MNIVFSSKTFELTPEHKQFFSEKLTKLGRYASLQLEEIEVVIDKVKRHGQSTSDAKVAVHLHRAGERLSFEEEAENLKQAFYRVYEKLEHRLDKELDSKKR